MINTLHFFFNDVKFALKQGSSLYILFLYPLFVIGIVGYAFSSPPSFTVPAGIYSDDASFTKLLSERGSFKLHEAENPLEAEFLVRRGEVPASFIVTRCGFYFNKSDGAKCDKKLFIAVVEDPSRSAEVSLLNALFDAALMEKMSVSAREISTFQARTTQLRDDIPQMRADLAGVRETLESEKTELALAQSGISLEEINQSIKSINSLIAFFDSATSESKSSIDDLNSLSYLMDDEKSQMLSDISGFQYSLSRMNSSAKTAQGKRDTYVSKLTYYSSRLYTIYTTLGTVSNTLYSLYRSSPSNATYSAYSEVNNARNEVWYARQDLENAKYDLQAIDFSGIQYEIGWSRGYLNSLSSKISSYTGNASQKIYSSISKLEAFYSTSQNTQKSLQTAKQRLTSLYTSAQAAKERMGQISGGIGKFVQKTYETENKLSYSHSVLQDFIAISPETFTPPQISKKEIIPSRNYFVFNFPFLLAMNIALFSLLFPIALTSKMRENDLEERLKSSGKVFSFIIGRFAGNYLIVLFQAILFFIFALVFFRVVPFSTALPFQAFSIALIVIPFAALGFLLSRIIRKVATGLLVSLLLCIPMIFLSGKLVPLSFMDFIMGTVSSFQPFTISLSMLEFSFFRCTGAWCNPLNYIMGASYLLFLAFLFITLSLLFWWVECTPGRTKWGVKGEKKTSIFRHIPTPAIKQ